MTHVIVYNGPVQAEIFPGDSCHDINNMADKYLLSQCKCYHFDLPYADSIVPFSKLQLLTYLKGPCTVSETQFVLLSINVSPAGE